MARTILSLLHAVILAPLSFGAVLLAQAPAATGIAAGKPTRIGLFNLVDLKTCKAREGQTIHITGQPKSGRVEIRMEPVLHSQAECKNVPVSGYAIYYQSDENFRGGDSVQIEIRIDEQHIADRYFFALDVK